MLTTRYFNLTLDKILWLLLWGSYAYFFQGGFPNQNSRFDLSLALAFEGQMHIDAFHENTVDKVRVGDHYYLEKSPITSYLALPVPWIASLFLNTYELAVNPRLGDWLLYLSTLLIISVPSAFAGVCFRRLLLFFNPSLSEKTSFYFAALVFLGTLALPYSTVMFSHQLVGALLIIGLYIGRHYLVEGTSAGMQRTAIIGALFFFSLAAATEYPSAILAASAACVFVLERRDFKHLLLGGLVALLPILAILGHNQASFGNFFAFGYGKLQGSAFESGMSQGFFGISLPDIENLQQLLFGVYRGLLVYSPVLIAAIMGFYYWPRSSLIKLTPILLGCVSLLLLNSAYAFWQGGVCFGPRHLVPMIPLLALGLAFLPLKEKTLFWLLPLALLSLAVNLLGTATTLFVSEDVENPLATTYFDLLKANSVSITPNSLLTSVPESVFRWNHVEKFEDVSFNMGELLGLTGFTSLLPLLLFWALLGVLAWRQTNNNQHHIPQEHSPRPWSRQGAA